MEKQECTYISEIDGKPITAYAYRLSREEQEHLRDQILRGYDETEVEKFLRSIELYLDLSSRILSDLNYRDRADHRNRLLAIKKRFETTRRDVLQISSGRFRVLPQRQCDSINYFGKPTENAAETIRRGMAFEISFIGEHLQRIIENLTSALEIEKVKRGDRRKADELHLAFEIARRFKKHIGTPHPFSGPFPEIIDYCFGIIGIKTEDHTRAIRQALKRLSCI